MSTPTEIILETQGLTKEFKGFVAVGAVSLKVRRGAIHALIGPNGAGKTTCFNLLTKFLTPTRGTILFNGLDITRETPEHIARRGIVRSYQIELLQCGQWDRSGEWLTDAYYQHNPNAASGREGVVYFFTQVMKVPRTAQCDKLTTEIVAVTAEDDLVTVLWPRSYKDPRNPGKCYSTTWFDTWRFVNGKADEHWDPATIAPPPSPERC